MGPRQRRPMVSGPERTCMGCRARADKSELIRFVLSSTGTSAGGPATVAVDLRQTQPGRGAYLHRTPECLQHAVRRRALGRALRSDLVDGPALVALMVPLLEKSGHSSDVA